jgi:hypothetical protein
MRAVAFALLLLAAACGPRLSPTNTLVSRPPVQELVDDLAAGSTVESKAVGYGGSPSDVYAIFERLRATATDAEMIALTRHRSAVVRSYAARHVIERDLDLGVIDPLFSDQAIVGTLTGCIGGDYPVAIVTVHTLCELGNQHAAASEKLATLAKAEGSVAEEARRCR